MKENRLKIKKHNTICLAMIVKNESKVIVRCLKSVLPIIDYWIICDTGSTDGTQEIIKNFFKENDVKGELYEHPWFNFAKNRSLCMEKVRRKCDYIITLDADEVFKYSDDFEMPLLTMDGYYIWTRNNLFEYQRIQLVSDKRDWCYKSILHEHIEALDQKDNPVKIGYINGIVNYPSPDGFRSSDKNKFKKDALTLEQGLLDEPDNARYRFYLAQSYRDSFDYDKAIENYQIRSKMEGFVEETFYAKYELGLCKLRLGKPFEEFAGYLLSAYSFRPTRLEPVHKLVRYCRMNNMAVMAWKMFKHVLETPMTCNDILFVEREVYTYKLLDELCVTAYWAGDHKASLMIAETLLKENKFPESERKRIIKNLNSNKDRLREGKNVLGQQIPKMTFNDNNNSQDNAKNSVDNKDLTAVFTNIIDTNRWGKHCKNQKYEISTGYGSSFEGSKGFRAALERYFKWNPEIKTVMDIGCGVWEFKRHEFDNKIYMGIDCVEKTIEFNQKNYGDKNKMFLCVDILDAKNKIPPEIDLCIIKDVLQHLSNGNVIKMLKKIKGKFKHVLIINDSLQEDDQGDISNGAYRPLDYLKYPLNEFNLQYLETVDRTKDILLMGNPIKIEQKNIKKVIEKYGISNNKNNSNNKMLIQNNKNNVSENSVSVNNVSENNVVENNVSNTNREKVEEEKVKEEKVKEEKEEKNLSIIDLPELTEDMEENVIVIKERKTPLREYSEDKKVLLVILARNKEHVLERYFDCISKLNYDKRLITIYINTNNNKDNTEKVLKSWVDINDKYYHKIDFETHSVEELNKDEGDPHNWNPNRFKVLGEIRNKSLQKTLEYGCDYYFVVDCDNFIEPDTLKDMINEDRPIIAPMLETYIEKDDSYSNYFCAVTPNGYYRHHTDYQLILTRQKIGTFEVPVVHCTYLIKRECIETRKLTYIDESQHYEFVIFSRSARKNGIKQFICNKKYYGCLVHFFDEKISLDKEVEIVTKFENKRLGLNNKIVKPTWQNRKINEINLDIKDGFNSGGTGGFKISSKSCLEETDKIKVLINKNDGGTEMVEIQKAKMA